MKNFFKILAVTLLMVVKGAVGFFAGAIRLLAGSAQTTPANDELSSSIRGGLLNYRTGKFDDGTDPAGIYKPD